MGAHFSGLSLKKWSPGRAALKSLTWRSGGLMPVLTMPKKPLFEGVVSRDRACSRFYDT